MNPAPNLVLDGPKGSGKTSIGRRLADRFGVPHAFVDYREHKPTPEMHSHIWGHSEEKWGTKFGTVVRIEHCEGCDKVFDAGVGYDADLLARVPKGDPFLYKTYNITFTGLCPHCAQKPDMDTA